jgi:hypothetical protein
MANPTGTVAGNIPYLDDPTCREIFVDLFTATAYGAAPPSATSAPPTQVVKIEFMAVRFHSDPPFSPDRRGPVARIVMTPGMAAALGAELQKILQKPPGSFPQLRPN